MVIDFLIPWAGNPDRSEKALATIEEHWQDNFTVMLLEVTNYTADPVLATRLLNLLKEKPNKILATILINGLNGYGSKIFQTTRIMRRLKVTYTD